MSNLFIESKYLDMIIDIFKHFCPNSQVFAYGSRLTDRAHSGSDLDLVIKDFPSQKTLSELRGVFSESNIPFLVDINIFETLPQSFKDEIEKNNVKIYPKS